MAESNEVKDLAQLELASIRFVARLEAGATPLREFRDPYARWAVASTTSVEAVPAPSSPAADELRVLLIPPALEEEWTAKAKEWMKGALAGAPAAARVPVGDGWLLWRPGQAVVVCPQEERSACLELLAVFAFYETEVRQLEAEVAADWAQAEADMKLAHDVKAEDLLRQTELGRMTERTLSRRMRHVRIEPHVERLGSGLPVAQRKAARLLVRKACLNSRLEFLDGQLETYEYIYELANQRMGEYANFRREYVVEWLIVIILALEVVFVIADMVVNYYIQ